MTPPHCDDPFRPSKEEKENARTEAAERITLTLLGIPKCLATFFGLTTA